MMPSDRRRRASPPPELSRLVLQRIGRRYLMPGSADALVVVASLALAWSGRSITATLSLQPAILYGLLAIGAYLCSNVIFGLYRRLWRYASAGEVVVIAGSAGAGTAILLVLDLLLVSGSGERPVPLSVVPFMGLFAFVGFVTVRYRGRVWTGFQMRSRALQSQRATRRSRVLILGAGEVGQLMAWRFLNQSEGDEYELIGFVDDDPAKAGMKVHGLPVLGNRYDIPGLVARHQVDLIIIAICKISAEAFRELLAICEPTQARVKVLPDIFQFLERTNGLPPIRDVMVEDLLGRKPVQIDRTACWRLLAGKRVLVTGAAGSIGSELCRQIASFGPECLLMLDNNESALFDLAAELESISRPQIRSIVADVTRQRRMQAVFERFRPAIVFHAAAYKHVPLMEQHPDEAVKVNVLGTLTVADLAGSYGAERFVFISTDKAVSPTSVMGATKRVAEMLICSRHAESATLYTGVRFGNVLGSRGSVIPTFEKQIDMGGPVTITHPEMTRYFMSIPEAVSLVIQAATATEGGDLFVLDMGEPIRIEELALRLIRLRGLRPGVDIPIKYTGIRPGEKLHEELTGDGDELLPTSHPAIFRVQADQQVGKIALGREIDALARLAEEQRIPETTAKLWEIVLRDGHTSAPVTPGLADQASD